MAWLFPFPLQRQLNLCSLSLNCHGKQWPQCADSCVWKCFPIFLSSGKLWGLCHTQMWLTLKNNTFGCPTWRNSISVLPRPSQKQVVPSQFLHCVKASRVHMHSLPFLYTGQKQARSVWVRKQRSTPFWSAITYLLFLLCSGRGTYRINIV